MLRHLPLLLGLTLASLVTVVVGLFTRAEWRRSLPPTLLWRDLRLDRNRWLPCPTNGGVPGAKGALTAGWLRSAWAA